MVEMFPLRSADAAYGKIKAMLSTLGDPFTRIISPKVFADVCFTVYGNDLKSVLPYDTSCDWQEYQSFRIGSDGNLQGVGLFINSEPRTGHLVSDQTHLETQRNLVFRFFFFQ